MPISTMMNEVLDYPAEERAEWLETAARRRDELLSGAVRAIPVEEVLAEARLHQSCRVF